MEIGDQRIRGSEAIAGANEDVGFADEGCGHSLRGAGFDQPARRCADRDHATAPSAGFADTGGGPGAHLAPFGVHFVLVEVVALYRQEGSRADVKRDERMVHAARSKSCQHRRREMQRGCRRGDGAFLLGEDRLVVASIGFFDFFLGRQIFTRTGGHFA